MEIQDLYKLFLQHPTITTDSRDVPVGSLFFALKGDTFDGNDYARAALEKGAACAIVDVPQTGGSQGLVLVPDVLTTLQQLAAYHRRQLGTTIIGITGTNGKTTTKELIAAVLKRKYRVHYTQGNFNNHIGVPKTLLQLRPEHEVAVIEMGANHPGEIRTLVNIVQPDYGIITNVGKAHLQGFGSFEGVVRTKGELYDYLRHTGGTAFINADNPHLAGISQGLQLVKYGQNPSPDILVGGRLVECNPFLEFSFKVFPEQESPTHETTVQTRLIGSYNLDNALAAACIGTHFHVSAADICAALSDYEPSMGRSQLTVTAHNRLVVDAYNANPTSMKAALDNFALIPSPHKMCILGQMGELGDVSHEEHQRVVDQLTHIDVETVWLVGNEFAQTDHPVSWRTFADTDQLKAALAQEQPYGQLILIKGSNSNHLSQLVPLL